MFIKNQDQFYEETGKRIKNARDIASISQETLASELGLTRASIINIEKGRHRPSLFLLIEIADKLMVNFISLVPINDFHLKRTIMDFTDTALNHAVSDGKGKIDKQTKTSVKNFLEAIQNQ